MKSFLNITVFLSAVMSIFSSALTLYEEPNIKEQLLSEREDSANTDSQSSKNMKKIYISHKTSFENKKNAPIPLAANSNDNPDTLDRTLSVFGVKLHNSKHQRNS